MFHYESWQEDHDPERNVAAELQKTKDNIDEKLFVNVIAHQLFLEKLRDLRVDTDFATAKKEIKTRRKEVKSQERDEKDKLKKNGDEIKALILECLAEEQRIRDAAEDAENLKTKVQQLENEGSFDVIEPNVPGYGSLDKEVQLDSVQSCDVVLAAQDQILQRLSEGAHHGQKEQMEARADELRAEIESISTSMRTCTDDKARENARVLWGLKEGLMLPVRDLEKKTQMSHHNLLQIKSENHEPGKYTVTIQREGGDTVLTASYDQNKGQLTSARTSTDGEINLEDLGAGMPFELVIAELYNHVANGNCKHQVNA